jgi:hypothetical protein
MLTYLSGKMRLHRIRVLVGDKVAVEIFGSHTSEITADAIIPRAPLNRLKAQNEKTVTDQNSSGRLLVNRLNKPNLQLSNLG